MEGQEYQKNNKPVIVKIDEKKKKQKKNFRALFSWLNRYWLLMMVSLIFSVLLPLTYSYAPQFLNYAFTSILGGKSPENVSLPKWLIAYYQSYTDAKKALIVVGASIVIFQATRSVMMYVNMLLRSYINESMGRNMRRALYEKLTLLPLGYYNEHKTGELIQRCTSDVEKITSVLTFSISTLFFIFISLGMGIYHMSKISLILMLPAIVLGPLVLVLGGLFFRIRSKDYKSYQQSEEEVLTVIQENVNGTRVVKAFNNEAFDEKRFAEKNDFFLKKGLKLGTTAAFFWPLIDIIVLSATFIPIVIAAFLTKNGTKVFSETEIIIFMIYFAMIANPFAQFGRILGNFSEAAISAGRIEEILKNDDEFVIDGTEEPVLKGEIEFKKVNFSFDNASEMFLNDISFKISPGETVAILGKTGSGKTTIANLLTRMFEINSGQILLDGHDITKIKKRHIRKNVGVVLQESFLYNRTIYENTKITNESATKEEVITALKNAHIYKDILKFKDGIDTLVGEKGTTLSGGQKQRLAIARMLLIPKPIVIFDDSLSAVDLETDYSIRQSLKNSAKSKTTIIITHRVTTAKEADKIIVLGKGKLLEIGTHDELVKKNGFYRLLWSVQGDNERELEKVLCAGESHE